MRRKSLILFCAVLLIAGFSRPALGATCTDESASGGICIILEDQFGNPILGDAGVGVRVTLEGGDGSFDDPNIVFGAPVLMTDDDADGDVEIAEASITGNYVAGGTEDWYFEVVPTTGYVEYDTIYAGGYHDNTSAMWPHFASFKMWFKNP